MSDVLTAHLPGHPSAETVAQLDDDVLRATTDAVAAFYASPQPLPPSVLHGLAAVVASWHGNAPLLQWHLDRGADPQLLNDADPDDRLLTALRRHVDLLAVSPALATAADQEVLAATGAGPDVVVLVSQLVSFESYLGRLLVALAALKGQVLPTTAAPARAPHTRARRKDDSATTSTGSRRPTTYTQEILAWEPWVPAPGEDELTDAQRESFARKASTNSVYFRLISRTPGVTRARSDLDNAIFLHRDGLPKAERELAATVASKVNDCLYCASVHSRKSTGFSRRGDDVDRLLAVDLPRDEDWRATDLGPLAASQEGRWAVLVDAAARLSAVRPVLDPTDVTRLREAGLTGPEVLDLLTAAAFFAWANRLMLSLGEAACPGPTAP